MRVIPRMGVLVASRATQKRRTRSSVKRSTFPLLSRGAQSEAWKPAGEQRKARTVGAYRAPGQAPHAAGDCIKRVKHLPICGPAMPTIAVGRAEKRGVAQR